VRLKFDSNHPKPQTMNLLQAASVVITLVVASLATWAGCRWWYGKKLLAAAHRLHKSDQGRLFSQQQTLQAKKQIEALKKELAEQRKALQDTEASRKRTRDLEQALLVAERAVEDNSGMMPLAPTHGFADTQIMP
jgi:sRNA-binding protein